MKLEIESKFNDEQIVGFFDWYGEPRPISKEAIQAINELFEDEEFRGGDAHGREKANSDTH